MSNSTESNSSESNSSGSNKLSKVFGDLVAPIGYGVLAEFLILVIGITLTVIYYKKMNKTTRIVAITLLTLSPFIVFGIILLTIKILLNQVKN